MADTTAAVDTKVEEKKGTPGVIVSAGPVVKADYTVTNFKDMAAAEEEVVVDDKKDKGDEGKGDDTTITTTKDKKDDSQPADDLTEEQLKKFFEKKGIAYDGLDNLKTKLAPPTPEKTEAEKKAEETAREQRLLAAHIGRGGTIEQFAEIKKLISADPKELGLIKEQEKLVKEGFTKDEAAEIVRVMHLQYTEEELAELTPEQIEALKKKSAYGLKKQENRGKYFQNTAKSYLDSLLEEISDQDAEAQKATQHSSKVEDALKAFQRKQTLQLGEYDGQKLDPVEYNVSDEVIQKVSEQLKDYATLKKTLINDDGSFNLDFLIPTLISSVSRETAVKTAYLEGGTKQVEVFKATFGEKPPALTNTSKKTNGVAGKIVSAGQVSVIPRPQ